MCEIRDSGFEKLGFHKKLGVLKVMWYVICDGFYGKCYVLSDSGFQKLGFHKKIGGFSKIDCYISINVC